MTKRNHKTHSPQPYPIIITVREINKLRDSDPTFPLAFAFHFKKSAKIHFFLYPQLDGDIFFDFSPEIPYRVGKQGVVVLTVDFDFDLRRETCEL